MPDVQAIGDLLRYGKILLKHQDQLFELRKIPDMLKAATQPELKLDVGVWTLTTIRPFVAEFPLDDEVVTLSVSQMAEIEVQVVALGLSWADYMALLSLIVPIIKAVLEMLKPATQWDAPPIKNFE